MTERTPCKIFGCKRTIKRFALPPQHEEWVCPKHWPTVPRSLRKLFFKARRAASKNPTPKNILRENRWWRRCVATAEAEQFGFGS